MNKLSDEERDSIMIARIYESLYPVLIPVEEQCLRIQAQNVKDITKVAELTWVIFKNMRGE